MAEETESVSSSSQDVPPGKEPGASRNSMLVASDSFEDVEDYLELSPDVLPGTIVLENNDTDPPVASAVTVGVRGEEPHDSGQPSGPEIAEACLLNKHMLDDSCSDGRATPIDETISKMTIQPDNPPENSTSHIGNDEVSQPSTVCAVVRKDSSEEEEVIDYVHTERWKQQRKHIFILSDSGKPIYSRHGDEDRLVTLMGVMQALVSFIYTGKDLIRCIIAGEHRFVFLIREHLILVAVARTGESMHHLLLQLTYVYNQVISILTQSQLSRIFESRRNYDLRRLLTGAEKFFDNLLNIMECDPSFFLGAVRCLPLESAVRDNIAQSISQNAKVKDLIFAILLADNQLITLVRMKQYFLHPLDLHLIFNLVSASESFKSAESWSPICLPKFEASGYLHAHISYLDESCTICLLLLTVDRDMFFTLSECKTKILDRLNKHNSMKAISDSVKKGKYKIGQVGIPDLRHFLYKSRSTAQFTSPEFEAPYTRQEDRDRVFGLYQYLHSRIHSSTRPLKILFHVGNYETLLGWVTSGFELYAVFSPLVTKHVAINSVNKLLKWIKKEEDRVFILNSPVF